MGQIVGTLTGFDDAGSKISIPSDPQDRPTVLYVFSQSCVWCQRTIPALKILIPQEAAHFRFVAADISAPFAPTKPYLSASGLKFEQTIHPDPQTRSRLGVVGTPTTLVIDRDGRIERIFNGALIGATLDSVNKFFGGTRKTDSASKMPANLAVTVAEHAFKTECVQDGARFSFGALIY